MRVAFFGSPGFALPTLEAVRERHEVVLVVAQPDKPAGRGMRKVAPAVAAYAREHDLPLSQPARLKGNREFLEAMATLAPDVAITAAYGKILRKELLDIPQHGFLNVHGSLLPKYRGAGPVQWALINGERRTGVSIMRTDVGLDTGPVCLARELAIDPDERVPQLFARIAQLGADALVEALDLLEEGRLECMPQDDALATEAPLLSKSDGDVAWQRSAREIYDRFRGVYAWPGTRFEQAGRPVRVHEMRVVEGGAGQPGEVLSLQQGVVVATGEDAIELLEVQPAGKGRMKARDWANGYRVEVGDQLA